MPTACENYLQEIRTNTGNTVVKLTDVNTNLVNVTNRLNEVKELLTQNNTKTDRTNQLLEALVISIKGAL